MTVRSLATVTVEECAEGSFVILRTDTGGQVHYGPFAEDGVEAAIMHLGSALAMAAMRYQTVLRGADFGPALHCQRWRASVASRGSGLASTSGSPRSTRNDKPPRSPAAWWKRAFFR